MSARTTLALVTVIAGTSLAISVGCSGDSNSGRSGSTPDVASVDRGIGLPVAEFETALATASAVAVESESEAFPIPAVTEIGPMVLTDSILFAAFSGGIVAYDFRTGSSTIAHAPVAITAIALHENKLYAGGENLFCFENGNLKRHEASFDAPVTCLYSHGGRLMVGTATELVSLSAAGRESIMGGSSVTAMVAEDSALWIGTAGQGLYRWDGSECRRRYLLRDAALFDTVNALDYRHNHLYVGTTNGLHIFDGGRWLVLTTEDGLPADDVRAVDASAWVVHIGTDGGMVSYYNGTFSSVGALEDKIANSIKTRGNEVIIATDFAGILSGSRGSIRTLVSPLCGSDSNLAALPQ